MNLFRIAYPVTSLGSGKRVVIWVAGCRKRCPGCISPEMQDPAAGNLIDTAVLANHLLSLPHTFDGITISGGEPFDQAETLVELVGALKQARPEWTVMVYTGYLLRTVRKKAECRSLLDKVDILVDGPYRQDIPLNHPWAGSGNQSLIGLTNVGQAMLFKSTNCKQIQASFGYAQHNSNMVIGIIEEPYRFALKKWVEVKFDG